MANSFMEILGGPFSVYYDGAEVLKNLILLETGEEYLIPPFDHFVYSFKAMARSHDSFNFYHAVSGGLVKHSQNCVIGNGDSECKAFIDSCQLIDHPVQSSYMYGGSHATFGSNGLIIYGHVDSRDLEDGPGYGLSKIKEKKPEPEPIDSRFDILDL